MKFNHTIIVFNERLEQVTEMHPQTKANQDDNYTEAAKMMEKAIEILKKDMPEGTVTYLAITQNGKILTPLYEAIGTNKAEFVM